MRKVIYLQTVLKYFGKDNKCHFQSIITVFSIQINMSVLQINSEQTITEVQRIFNRMFPFLKIEFYRTHKSSAKRKEKLNSLDVKVGEIPNAKNFRKISFNSEMTVTQLKKSLQNEYGIVIQIFRKSGSIWLETNATNNWTLDRQNAEAKTLEEHLKFNS